MISSLLFWLRRLERGIAMFLLVAIFAVVLTATCMRYIGKPVIWELEITQAMFVWLCLLAGDITLQNFGHFSVSAVADLLPPRARLVLDTVTSLIVMALLAFLAWYAWTFADMSSGRPLPILGVSEGVATTALPVGFALMFITMAEQLVMRWTHPQAEATHAPRDVM